MNCSEVHRLLMAYLANEVTPSEKKLIQNHLAACADCQNEMRILTVLQTRIRESLNEQAAESVPSPHAWSRLQARLETPARASRPSRLIPWPKTLPQEYHKGAFGMKRIALTTLAILILLAGMVGLVPGVRAAVLEQVKGWFGYDFPSPNSATLLSLSTNWGFSPFTPGYVPDGMEITGSMIDGDEAVDTLGLCYQPKHREQGDPFVVITQHYTDSPVSLTAGTEVSIGDVSGRIEELPGGEVEWCLGPSGEEGEPVRVPEGEEAAAAGQFPPDDPLSYASALRLTYLVDGVKFEIFGPYPEAELIRIAKSMQQASMAAEQPAQP